MSYTGTNPSDRQPEGYRQLTVGATAVALSAATGGVPASATSATIIVSAQPIRTRDDGTAPTTTVGMPYVATDRIELTSRKQINQFRAIRTAGSDSVLEISYYSARKAYN